MRTGTSSEARTTSKDKNKPAPLEAKIIGGANAPNAVAAASTANHRHVNAAQFRDVGLHRRVRRTFCAHTPAQTRAALALVCTDTCSACTRLHRRFFYYGVSSITYFRVDHELGF